jgi:hypothetical protein
VTGVNRDTRRSCSRGGSSRPTQLRAALAPDDEQERRSRLPLPDETAEKVHWPSRLFRPV